MALSQPGPVRCHWLSWWCSSVVSLRGFVFSMMAIDFMLVSVAIMFKIVSLELGFVMFLSTGQVLNLGGHHTILILKVFNIH